MLQQFYPQIQHEFEYELNRGFDFSAAHHIPHKDAGKCAQVHGHTYFINLTIAGDTLDDSGFLVNFSDLKRLIHNRYDHTLLNDHVDFHGVSSEDLPTTENVARTIWGIVQEYLYNLDNAPLCLQVIVRETPTSYVVYRPKRYSFLGDKEEK